MTINLTKASILLLFLRIFVQRWFRTICYTLLSIILAYMIATTCSSIFQCSPIPRAWNRTIDGTCISLTMNWNANAGFSIATDIIILFLPQYPIWKSKLPVSQKRALMGVFALGGLWVPLLAFPLSPLQPSSSPHLLQTFLPTPPC